MYLQLMTTAEKKILGLLRSHETTCGSFKSRLSIISDMIQAGAEAVKAINGVSISALNLPINLNAFRKSCPLLYDHDKF